MKILYYYPAMKQNKKFTIPSTVTRIARYAFANNNFLEQLNMGKNIYAVDMWWFDKCANLKRITMPPELQSVDSYVEYSGLESLEKVTLSESNKYIFTKSILCNS